MKRRPILVIDHDPLSCELVSAILTDAGFEVVSTPDGPSGIEAARAVQPAVIILEAIMPGIDGIETLTRLKRDPALGDIPVVGITASSDWSYIDKAFRGGAKFFLLKPFLANDLRRVVELAAEWAQRATQINRRRYPRHPAEVSVRCVVRGDAKMIREVVGHTGNVSLRGLLLLLSETVAPGTIVRLGLGLPEGPITANGKVRWQDPQPIGDGRFRHGIQLLRFGSDSGQVGYSRYISQIAAGSSAK